MSVSWFKYLQLAYCSKPSTDRILYRAIAKQRPRSIVELGLGLGERSAMMIRLAQRFQPDGDFKYTGLDLFEGRDPRWPGMTLKRAHRLLGNLAEHIQLLPGDPCLSLAQKGNLLVKTDLVIVDLDHNPDLAQRIWTPLTRLIHEHSRLYVFQLQASSRKRQFTLLPNELVYEMAADTEVALPRAA